MKKYFVAAVILIALIITPFYVSAQTVSFRNVAATLWTQIEDFVVSVLTQDIQAVQTIGGESKTILIFVDRTSYASLTPEISRFAEDIHRDIAAKVIVYKVNTYDPFKIKDIMKSQFNGGNLLGAILIGDIPTFSLIRDDGSGYLTDAYYRILNANCRIDSNSRVLYSETADCGLYSSINGQDMWVGRITPPVTGDEGIVLLRNYFDKNHAYRIGDIQFDKRFLFYSGDTLNSQLLQEQHFTSFSRGTGYARNEINAFDFNGNPTINSKKDYLEELEKSAEFAVINVHGTPTYQWLGRGVLVNSSDLKTISPNIFAIKLLSCSNGVFELPDYFAGWLLFRGNTLIVEAAPIDIFSGYILNNYVDQRGIFFQFRPFQLGATYGEVARNTEKELLIFGDPTLRLKRDSAMRPRISLNGFEIDFGSHEIGSETAGSLTIQNIGNAPLEILTLDSSPTTVDGTLSWGNDDGRRYLENIVSSSPSGSGFEFADVSRSFPQKISISPGGSRRVNYEFKPGFYESGRQAVGKYEKKEWFMTNDINMPYVTVQLKGTGTAIEAPIVSLTLSKTIVKPSESLVISWGTNVPDREDKIFIPFKDFEHFFEIEAPTNGLLKGTKTITAPPFEGQFDVVYFSGRHNVSLTRIPFQVSSLPTPTPVTSPISVLSPTGGETWRNGETQTIRWSAPSSVSQVNIYLVSPTATAGQQSQWIIGQSANTGSFNWYIGSGVTSGQFFIKVADSSNPNAFGQSAGAVTITSGGALAPTSTPYASLLNSIKNVLDQIQEEVKKIMH